MTVSSPSSPSTPVESYLITLPRLRIDGLWYGSPYIELADTSHIIGGGHVVILEYKGKGYFSGKSHSFKATVTPMPGLGGQGREDVVVEGTWNENSKFTRGAAGSFHDTDDHVKEEVVPLKWTEEAGELETRKLWHLVAKGIREGDFDLASQEKTRIEVKLFFTLSLPLLSSTLFPFFCKTTNKQNDQRQRRKDEKSAGTTWPLKHFNYEKSDPVCKSSLMLFALYVAKSRVYLRRAAGKINQNNPTCRRCLCVQGQLVSKFQRRRCGAIIKEPQF